MKTIIPGCIGSPQTITGVEPIDSNPRCPDCRHQLSRHTLPQPGSLTRTNRCVALAARCACPGFPKAALPSGRAP